MGEARGGGAGGGRGGAGAGELARPSSGRRDGGDGGRARLAPADRGPAPAGEDEAALLARRMLAAAPVERSAAALRVWADACSVAALQIHRLLDPLTPATRSTPAARAVRRASPLVAAELRRQVAVLELLAGHGPAGLRPALEVSTEGRRVLRAVVSRRARGTVLGGGNLGSLRVPVTVPGPEMRVLGRCRERVRNPRVVPPGTPLFRV